MDNKQRLINHLLENGKDMSWAELATKFKITNGSGVVDGEAARNIWRREKKKQINEDLEDNQPDISGSIKARKFWQTADGQWRQSITLDEKEDNLKKLKDELLNEVKALSPTVKKYKLRKKKGDDILLEISLPDIHYGNGSVEELETNFFNQIYDLLDKASGLNVTRFLLPIGNDGLNSEGLRYTTTKGTPQRDSVDWDESFRGYWKLMIKAVDILKRIAPVDVLVVPGNHDYERMFYIGEVVSAWYRNDKNVTVDNSRNYRKYVQYGQNMIMFTHGDKERADHMAMNLPVEQPEMFANTKYREVHCGHLHKEMVLDEYKTIKVRFIPSICTRSEWIRNKGYKALRCGQAFIWNKEKGFEGYLQSNID